MMRKRLLALALLICLLSPSVGRAEATREFIMSATYGVLAGTLVGAATLAFTDKPGDNLKNIARGASYGLYAGIFLGLYVIYGVSDGSEPPPAYEQPGYDDGLTPEDRSTNPEEPLGPAGKIDVPRKLKTPAGFATPEVFPLISDRGLEGGAVAVRYLF